MKNESVEEIQKVIDNMTLREYVKNRLDYYKSTHEKLKEWIVLKKYILRSDGSIWMTDHLKNDKDLNNVIEFDKFFDVFSGDKKYFSFYGIFADEIPDINDVCEICGTGWNKNNINDYHIKKDYQNDSKTRYHIKCYGIKSRFEAREYYEKLIKDAGIKNPLLVEIPNEYDKNDFDPWFNLILPQCDIKIGWRKRVISISVHNYSDERPNYKYQLNLSEIFKDQDVTKEYNLVHAWSEENAVKYLIKIIEELKKPVIKDESYI